MNSMPETNHVLELLPAYALDCLDEVEARRVTEHIAACQYCRTELRAYQEVAGQLALIAPGASPSPELRSRLQDRIQSLKSTRAEPSDSATIRRPLFGGLRPVGALIGLVLLLVLLASNILLWQRLNHLEVLAGPLGMRAIVLQNTAAAPQASAFVIVSSDGQDGVLVVDQLQALDADHEYQVWLVRGEQNTGVATFTVDGNGYRGMRIEAPRSLIEYSAIRITIEPTGGSQAPLGQEVLHGSLFNP